MDKLENLGLDRILEYDELLNTMALASGRSMENAPENPHFEPSVTTPELLIRFLCAQPRLTA